MTTGLPSAIFFESPAQFENWLESNHETAPEVLVGFRRRSTGLPSMTWPESVEVALCFGWIDGIRRGIDESSYSIRFTPRRKRSIWSRVNIDLVAKLEAEGRMRPAGRAAFEARDEARSKVYSYERNTAEFPADLAALFEIEAEAWTFFQSQPVSYRRPATWWVISAKREKTRLRRLSQLIECSAQGRRIDSLNREKPRQT